MSVDGASPLGRYAVEGAPGVELVDVHLGGVPLPLMLEAREHHDGLLRELRLLALGNPSPRSDPPARLVELIEVLGRRYGAARARRDEDLDAALSRGEVVGDLVYTVPRTAADAVSRLDDLIREADDFCASQQLMTLERSPEVKRFVTWYIEQFVSQCAGSEPVAWTPGPA